MAKILIVDDNLLNLELATDVLELADFDVVTACSGKESIEKAKQTLPDLVLMDLRMPEMSGLDAMLALHRNETTSHIPVVVLTASAMKGEAERLINSGFFAYLQKPIDPSCFADQITAFLNEQGAGD
jgi:CheY-like chemotaxis protein